MRSAPCCGRQCSYGLAPSDEPSVAHCRRRIVFKRLAPQVQSGRRQLSYSPGEQTGLARRLFLEFLQLFAISMVTIELLHGERTMRRFLILAILIAPTAISGCQTSSATPAPWRWKPCNARPYDAGFCEQPTNFLLWDYIAGGKRL